MKSVKKYLLIIRHSKTEHSYGLMKDSQRKLTEKGHRDADKMSKFIFNQGYKIERLLISPATRTQQSAQYYIDTFQLQTNEYETINKLYASSAETIADIIVTTAESINTLAVMAHNPGVSDFLISNDKNYFGDMSTSSVGVFEFEGSWHNFIGINKKPVSIFTLDEL